MADSNSSTRDDFLSPANLAKRYNVNRSTIMRWANEGVLPEPLRINGTTPRWRVAVLESWEAEQPGGE